MRRLIAMASIAGAPGVTTTALALAAAWPQEADGGVRPVVVETGVWGGDLAARFGLPHSPGLLDVAAVVGQPQPGSLLGAVRDLPVGVRAVLAPSGRGPCTEAVRLLGGDGGLRVLRGEAKDYGSALLDLGRLTPESQELAGAADEVLLVTRGGADALAHVYAQVSDLARVAGRLTLCVLGECPYAPSEVSAALEVENVMRLPWDAKGAGVLGGTRHGRLQAEGFRTSPLLRTARELAERLVKAGQGGPSRAESLAEVLRERSIR
ncbi:MinD/ParA family ATP-binding protein [Streptomyces sp. CA-250714]|uniref:MinD/ParA family ATP-binding protein n=1 Tax=Streptomyces sp. CA-250714 TaxID=3240060 RepID=UPI003D947AAA